MANWNAHVQFRDLCNLYNTKADDELVEIQRVMPFWIERFEKTPLLAHFVPSLKRIKTESQFNRLLDLVYDYCDQHRIWVEL